jgi:hypothetical protein
MSEKAVLHVHVKLKAEWEMVQAKYFELRW